MEQYFIFKMFLLNKNLTFSKDLFGDISRPSSGMLWSSSYDSLHRSVHNTCRVWVGDSQVST